MREPSAPPTAVSFADRPKKYYPSIGDGMALSQVTAGIYWKGGLSKSIFGRFRHVGFHKSISADNLVTDSAAGATAFACGKKTYNGAIGILIIIFLARLFLSKVETKAALPAWSSLVQPPTPPLAFFAHENMRAFTEQIAYDYVKTRPIALLGVARGTSVKIAPMGST